MVGFENDAGIKQFKPNNETNKLLEAFIERNRLEAVQVLNHFLSTYPSEVTNDNTYGSEEYLEEKLMEFIQKKIQKFEQEHFFNLMEQYDLPLDFKGNIKQYLEDHGVNSDFIHVISR